MKMFNFIKCNKNKFLFQMKSKNLKIIYDNYRRLEFSV